MVNTYQDVLLVVILLLTSFIGKDAKALKSVNSLAFMMLDYLGGWVYSRQKERETETDKHSYISFPTLLVFIFFF